MRAAAKAMRTRVPLSIMLSAANGVSTPGTPTIGD